MILVSRGINGTDCPGDTPDPILLCKARKRASLFGFLTKPLGLLRARRRCKARLERAPILRSGPKGLQRSDAARGGPFLGFGQKKFILGGGSVIKGTICGYQACPRLQGGRCRQCERVELLLNRKRCLRQAQKREAPPPAPVLREEQIDESDMSELR